MKSRCKGCGASTIHSQECAHVASVEFMLNASSKCGGDDDGDDGITQGPCGSSHELKADAASVRVGLE